MTSIDSLACRSGLRGKSPTLKVSYALLTLAVCLLAQNSLVPVLVLGVNLHRLIRHGGVSPRCCRSYLAIPLVFLMVSSGCILLNWSSSPMDLFAIPLGRHYLTGSRAALRYAVRLALTALACVSCLYYLAMTTPVPDILHVLKKWHCPDLLLELMLLIHRYSFLLLSTARAIRTAQKSRLGNRSFPAALKSFGGMGSALFVRSVLRARRQYEAIEARCYDGSLRVLSPQSVPEPKALTVLLLWEGLLVFVGLWRI